VAIVGDGRADSPAREPFVPGIDQSLGVRDGVHENIRPCRLVISPILLVDRRLEQRGEQERDLQ
jgi:hypothetical protein